MTTEYVNKKEWLRRLFGLINFKTDYYCLGSIVHGILFIINMIICVIYCYLVFGEVNLFDPVITIIIVITSFIQFQPLVIILIDVCINIKICKLYELINIGVMICFMNLVLQSFFSFITSLIAPANGYIISWLIMSFSVIVFVSLAVIIILFVWLKKLVQFCSSCNCKEELCSLKN